MTWSFAALLGVMLATPWLRQVLGLQLPSGLELAMAGAVVVLLLLWLELVRQLAQRPAKAAVTPV
jgi:predicted outer membrane lipoprotein